MNKFGWSLPPGVSKLPGEEEEQCEICHQWCENCTCPECTVCGDIGNPGCIGIHMSPETWGIKYWCGNCGMIQDEAECSLCEDGGIVIPMSETCCLCGELLFKTGFGGVQIKSGQGLCPSCFREQKYVCSCYSPTSLICLVHGCIG